MEEKQLRHIRKNPDFGRWFGLAGGCALLAAAFIAQIWLGGQPGMQPLDAPVQRDMALELPEETFAPLNFAQLDGLGEGQDALAADLITLDFSQLCEYYGADIRPDSLPADLAGNGVEEGTYGIFARGMSPGKEGAVYFDLNSIHYSSPDGNRELAVSAERGLPPQFDFLPETEPMELKLTGGARATAARYSESGVDSMYAWFEAGPVGYFLTAKNLTEAEFSRVVQSYFTA